MKKLTKILSMVMIAAIISSGIVYQQAEAKDINFTGKYKNGRYAITLNRNAAKSSYAIGEKCGNMTLTYDGYSVMGGYSQGEVVFEKSPIKKIGKNKYKVVNSGYRGYTCAIAVKKKTITVKFTSPKGAMKVGKNGTYKLK